MAPNFNVFSISFGLITLEQNPWCSSCWAANLREFVTSLISSGETALLALASEWFFSSLDFSLAILEVVLLATFEHASQVLLHLIWCSLDKCLSLLVRTFLYSGHAYIGRFYCLSLLLSSWYPIDYTKHIGLWVCEQGWLVIFCSCFRSEELSTNTARSPYWPYVQFAWLHSWSLGICTDK